MRTHGAKMGNFASEDAASTWGQLEVFMSRWREIDALIEEPGPFIYIAGRSGKLRPIPLCVVGILWRLARRVRGLGTTRRVVATWMHTEPGRQGLRLLIWQEPVF